MQHSAIASCLLALASARQVVNLGNFRGEDPFKGCEPNFTRSRPTEIYGRPEDPLTRAVRTFCIYGEPKKMEPYASILGDQAPGTSSRDAARQAQLRVSCCLL